MALSKQGFKLQLTVLVAITIGVFGHLWLSCVCWSCMAVTFFKREINNFALYNAY